MKYQMKVKNMVSETFTYHHPKGQSTGHITSLLVIHKNNKCKLNTESASSHIYTHSG